jgi:drug/metabolite transporter (DMT)-like permease
MDIHQNTRAWGILIILSMVWGSSFLLIKLGLEHFSAAQVGSLRIAIAFLFILPFALRRIRQLRRADLLWLCFSGLVGNLTPSLLFAYAEQVVSSSVAGVLNSLTPIFTGIVAVTLFGSRFSKANIAGIAVGLVGAVGLMITTNNDKIDINTGYAMLIALATVCYAFNVNIIKNKLSHLHPVSIAAFAFLMAGPVALIHLIGFTPVVASMAAPGAMQGLLYVSILAIAGSALALMLFNHLVQITNVIFSASVTYLIPVVAIMVGIAAGEEFKARYLLWFVCIAAGVFLVNRVPGRGKRHRGKTEKVAGAADAPLQSA